MSENLKTHILDIITILLPGLLLMMTLGQDDRFSIMYLPLLKNEHWIQDIIYLGVAYMLGHFIFFLGSFLDKMLFERVKKFIWKDHRLVNHIIRYKIEKTGIDDANVLNAFKWSCAWLLANQPEMYGVVERHIAESKFFRSLIIVLLITLAIFAPQGNYTLMSILVSLIVLSLMRYMSQRQKSIETAYHFVITASGKVFDTTNDQ